jgi:hypothetical protein
MKCLIRVVLLTLETRAELNKRSTIFFYYLSKSHILARHILIIASVHISYITPLRLYVKRKNIQGISVFSIIFL